MAIIKWPDKDPDEVLDYFFIWTDRLAGDTIATSTMLDPVVVESDGDDDNTLAIDDDSFDNTAVILGETEQTATVWLSAGTAGKTYLLTNRITTTNVPPRTMDQTAKVKIKAK